MSNYSLPNFIYPVYSVNYNPIQKKLYSQSTIPISLDFISQQLDLNSWVILDFNRDHSNFLFGPTNVLDAYDFLTSKGYNNIVYLSSENLNNNNIRFFPNWLYCKSKMYSEININKKTKRQYKVSCLNRFPSPHRIYFYYHLLHKSYFNECLTSFLGLVNPYNNFIEIGEYNPIYQHIPNEIKNFYEKTKYSKKIDSELYNWSNDHDPNHSAYIDTYLNIITESTYYHSFFTEKTAKALASEQLFMLVGGSNSITNLKLLNIECFDSINLEYDSIADCYTRVDAILNKLDSIYHNIEEQYWHHKKAIDYNSSYFLSSNFRNKCLETVRDLLK